MKEPVKVADETRETRLKRLRMRCWRRGTKEMDMILGPFADGPMSGLSDTDLTLFEELLSENDQDLYAWISGREEPNPSFLVQIGWIKHHLAQK